MSDAPIIANDLPFPRRTFEVEGVGRMSGANALLGFCEKPATLRDLIPGQTSRLVFRTGMGASQLLVSRVS